MMIEEICSICRKKIIAEKDDDISSGEYGSICSIKCFDELCINILGMNRKEFIK